QYKLVGFTLAGALAALAGALFANLNYMASPSQLHWMESGILIVMVILGGMGSFLGGVLGAAVLLSLEEVLAAYTAHWPLIVGFILLGIVLFLPNGVASIPALLRRKRPSPVTLENPTLHKEVQS